MSTTGSLNLAAKRAALADRNAAMNKERDALKDGKSGTSNILNTTSDRIIATAQENRVSGYPKNVSKMGLSQPAQRPRTVVPSASMSQLKSGSINVQPRPSVPAAARNANYANFVYSDSQPGRPKPAPAGSSLTVPEDLPQAKPSHTGASTKQAPLVNVGYIEPVLPQPKPSYTGPSISIKQAPLINVGYIEPVLPQPDRYQPLNQQRSRSSEHGEAPNQKPNYSSLSQSSLPPVDETTSAEPGHPEGDGTESLYVDAIEDLSQDQLHFLTNSSAQFLVPPTHSETVPNRVAEPHDSRATSRPSSNCVVPEARQAECETQVRPPSLVDDHPCSSDYDEEEDYRYDEPASSTAHSEPPRGDNTTGGVTTIMLPPKLTEKGMAELEAAKRIVESKRTPDDIQEDAWDVSMVAEYGDEIFQYMKQQESSLLPNPHYMEIQTEIQWSMRSVLMDWVVQVHTRFGLLPETLFLTVNYIDRFLSFKVVSLGKLQLVGATAIFIAAKYEEINCPSVQEIVYMVDGGYTADEILKAERFMLSMLDFELGWPGPMSFLRRISKADDYDLETRTMAKYFLEVAIMDERLVATPPSYIAAGAHCLSRLVLRKGLWTPAHVHYSSYTYQQLKPLVSMLMDCCRTARRHHTAVYEKYSDKRYRCASTFVESEIAKGFTLPFEHRLNMRLSVEFYCEEGVSRSTYTGPQAVKMSVPTRA
ncbi:hypothetical protein F5Y17DRAFT_137543 [Xylariaceae sp. FL0594]|nr:hypothetical protein F5Y17DRAFT_137543 [Xylariaceae sp. FL0594]